MKPQNLVGRRYGRLVVLELAPKRKKARWWLCRCDCGTLKETSGNALNMEHIRSCGCLRRETSKIRAQQLRKHGACSGGKISTEWKSWYAMKDRCKPTMIGDVRRNYIERGITVCDRWVNSFENFIADMGLKPKDGNRYSIDRIDNSKGYSPENCRWATYTEQANNRRCCVYMTCQGVTKTATEWARYIGVSFGTIKYVCEKHGVEDGLLKLQERLRDLTPPKR